MNGRLYLSDEQFAEYFIQANGPAHSGESPVDLEPRVERWLARSDMAHRNAFRIAIEVVKMAKPAPILTPQSAAFEHDQVNGISDPPADEAARIRDMPLAEWERERSKYFRRLSGEGVGILGPIGH